VNQSLFAEMSVVEIHSRLVQRQISLGGLRIYGLQLLQPQRWPF